MADLSCFTVLGKSLAFKRLEGMKNRAICLNLGISLLFGGSSFAASLYVDLNCANPTPPYASWNTAATNIQDAVDAALAGDSIFVTNGIYASGQSVMYGQLTNRVTIDKAVTVQSVNGPAVTMIQGNMVFTNAARCVYLTNGASLVGFTLTNGGTSEQLGAGIAGFGGGAWCETNGTVILSNCIVTGNLAGEGGGGVFGGTLYNCTLSSNRSAGAGAGANSCTLSNCTLVYNSTAGQFGPGNPGGGAANCILDNCVLSSNLAGIGGGAVNSVLRGCTVATNTAQYPQDGGGISDSAATNCVIAGNSAGLRGGGASGGTLVNCTVIGNSAQSAGGTYNSTLANCIVYYNNASSEPNYMLGLFGSMGYCCTVPAPPGPATGNITNAPLFVNLTGGDLHLQAGSPCIDSGNNADVSAATDLDGNPRVVSDIVDMGAYEFQVRYVDANGTNPTPPFVDWSTAATNIQDAVDAAPMNALVLVTNGIYASGQSVMNSQLTNRLSIDKAVTVQSVNGPAVTIIEGSNVFTNAVRCVYLTNGATLSGFTLANGGAGTSGYGGGAWCETNGPEILSNCIVTGNSASLGGGGVYGGRLYNCMLNSNLTSTSGAGGGADNCTLSNCTLIYNSGTGVGFGGTGGGAANCILQSCFLSRNTTRSGGGAANSALTGCIVTSNSAVSAGFGGGLYECTATNCVIVGNGSVGTYGGGGAMDGTLINCTIAGNWAGQYGGGTYGSALVNCINYYNSGSIGSNYYHSSLAYCCTAPVSPYTTENSSNAPIFVDLAGGDFHLQTNSPCVNSGKNLYISAATDLDGNPRIQGGTVDIGAYEYQTPGSVISYDWLEQYGLPLDGSVDYSNLDGSGLSVYQKWIAGLNPTNSSVLMMLPPSVDYTSGGLIVLWQGATNRLYTVERATNLSVQPAFTVVSTNILGIGFFDTNAVGPGPYFYRTSVQR
jgi:hypothetical protein